MIARSRKLVVAALAAAALLGGCAPSPPDPLTEVEAEELCEVLHDHVALTAAREVYSAVFLYRYYGPALPAGGESLPYPDCAYLARSNFADRLEVFYFGPEESIVDDIEASLRGSGYAPEGKRWLRTDGDGQPWSYARIEQFYAAPDAALQFRVYAELINRPGVIVSVTSRRPRTE